MKITDIRTIRLVGPRVHAVGGGESSVSKLLIRVDTDSELYGLGEAEDFIGVRDAIDYVRRCLIDRDLFNVRPYFYEIIYGTLPPHTREQHESAGRFEYGRPRGLDGGPHDTPTGPIIWAFSGVDIALCDLIGKALSTPCYNLFGGKFRDSVRIYLDRRATLSCQSSVSRSRKNRSFQTRIAPITFRRTMTIRTFSDKCDVSTSTPVERVIPGRAIALELPSHQSTGAGRLQSSPPVRSEQNPPGKSQFQ